MSKIQVNEIVNHFDTGAPDCPKGLTVTGFTTFSGGVSIGGTLIYEDVSNIDSVGVITARDAVVISEDNAIHFRGTAADDADAILRASAGGGQLLINSRNDAIINIDSNNDSTDAHFAVAHGAATGSSTELLRVQENGRMGQGTSSPNSNLHVKGGSESTDNLLLTLQSDGVANDGSLSTGLRLINSTSDTSIHGGEVRAIRTSASAAALTFSTYNGSSIAEALRITSAGLVGIGTDAAGASSNTLLTLQATGSTACRLVLANTGSGSVESTQIFSQNNDLAFQTNGSHAARIDSDGKLLVGKTSAGANNNGAELRTGAGSGDYAGTFSASSHPVMLVNRNTDDGVVIRIRGQGNDEGNISVSGSDVTLNGATLSRWSQLPGGAERIEILRGSVLSNLDEMCEWGDEDNEQMNRMKVSDVEGDRNVAGVFRCWDDDDDTYTNDFYCAMTGDFVIRIAQGTTVARGDLLMSAGDGTAKPQGDDIVRSKTVAKVTSTTVSATYTDGSYCVPCVLMAC